MASDAEHPFICLWALKGPEQTLIQDKFDDTFLKSFKQNSHKINIVFLGHSSLYIHPLNLLICHLNFYDFKNTCMELNEGSNSVTYFILDLYCQNWYFIPHETWKIQGKTIL